MASRQQRIWCQHDRDRQFPGSSYRSSSATSFNHGQDGATGPLAGGGRKIDDAQRSAASESDREAARTAITLKAHHAQGNQHARVADSRGFQRRFAAGGLSFGVFFPIEALKSRAAFARIRPCCEPRSFQAAVPSPAIEN
jgi:hypothetical protein